jgi:hypothetical protein
MTLAERGLGTPDQPTAIIKPFNLIEVQAALDWAPNARSQGILDFVTTGTTSFDGRFNCPIPVTRLFFRLSSGTRGI